MKTLLKGTSQKGLIGATWGFFLGFAALAVYGPLAKQMKDLMGLSGFMLGILVAIPQLTGSLLRIPFGAWADSAGARKPFLILLLCSMLGIAILTYLFHKNYPDNFRLSLYPLLIICGIMCGCGVATFSVGVAQTSYWFPQKQQGYALGMYAGIGNLAPGIFIFLVPFLFKQLGIVGTYLIWLVFLVVGILVYYFFAKDAYYFQLLHRGLTREEAATKARQLGQELIPAQSLLSALSTSARISRTWVLVFLYFTSFGGFLALSAWFPTYWSIFHQQSLILSGMLTAIGFAIFASVIRAFTGPFCDRWGGERITLLGFILASLGTLILAFSARLIPALFGEILTAIGMGMANAAIFKMVPKYIPQSVGGAAGWIGGLGAFGGFVFPPLLGLFVDLQGTKGYAQGFLILVAFCAIAVIVAFYLNRKSQH